MSQEQKKKSTSKHQDAQPQPEPVEAKKLTAKGEKIKENLDALLDEIDEILEENAEEFLSGYVQRGGE